MLRKHASPRADRWSRAQQWSGNRYGSTGGWQQDEDTNGVAVYGWEDDEEQERGQRYFGSPPMAIGDWDTRWEEDGWDAAPGGKSWDNRNRWAPSDDVIRRWCADGGDLGRVNLSWQRLDDDMLRWWCADEGPNLLWQLGLDMLDDLDVSCNRLTDKGVSFLVDFLLQHRQCVRRVKLFRNMLREPVSLCRLIEDTQVGAWPGWGDEAPTARDGSATGLQELHMSRNCVTAEGLRSLLESLRRRAAANGRPKRPFWLRLERNDGLTEPARRLAEEFCRKGLGVCLEGGHPNSGCNLRHCRLRAAVHLHIEGPNASANP